MSRTILDAMNRRYGSRWFTYQPPEARPFQIIQNAPVAAGIPAGGELKLQFARQSVLVNEIAVVNTYCVQGLVTVPNPDWVGFRIEKFNEYDFQGRIAWRPQVERNPPFEVSSVYNGIPYQNGGAAFIYPSQDPYISALRHQNIPRFMAMPGQEISIEILYRPDTGGIEPPPVGLFYHFIAELRGYYLAIPEDYELYHEDENGFYPSVQG